MYCYDEAKTSHFGAFLFFYWKKNEGKKNDIIIARGKHSPEPLVDEADSAATVHFYAR